MGVNPMTSVGFSSAEPLAGVRALSRCFGDAAHRRRYARAFRYQLLCRGRCRSRTTSPEISCFFSVLRIVSAPAEYPSHD